MATLGRKGRSRDHTTFPSKFQKQVRDIVLEFFSKYVLRIYFYHFLKNPTESKYQEGKSLSKYQRTTNGIETSKYCVKVMASTGRQDC